MWSRVFVFLIGAVYIYCQVMAEDVFNAELMVESNVTLEAQTLLSSLNSISDLQVNKTDGNPHTVTLSNNELVAECLIVGDDSSCNCSKGFVWSNDVCYNYDCCRETTCSKNVSHITPLCIAAVSVCINGSVETNSMWTPDETTKLKDAFEKLNGLLYTNITGHRSSDGQSNNIADFEVVVSVKVNTSVLEETLQQLKTDVNGDILVDTHGMATIEAPGSTVCYLSDPLLKCTFEEATSSSDWTLIKANEYFKLNNGNVVQLDQTCATSELPSCVAVRLKEVTDVWTGTYECGFTSGLVRHAARTQLSVASLPDEITMTINPLTADCSATTGPVPVNVNAIIKKTTATYNISWMYNGQQTLNQHNTSEGEQLVFSFTADVKCEETSEAQLVNITFKNKKGQARSTQVYIPVIYAGKAFCKEDGIWPKTPAGATVINRTCPEGRVGYRSRTCETEGPKWQDVYSNCVDEKLNEVVNAADKFLKGLGATQEVAMDIFEGLNNRSKVAYHSSDDMADIAASVKVLNLMSRATEQAELEEEVLPDFVEAASNMLNSTWSEVNDTIRHRMSVNYLYSVEGLVKNIKINRTNSGLDRENLDLKFCSQSDCRVSVFNIGVNLSKTTGVVKAVAVKNLMDKLSNTFRDTERTPLLLSATMPNSHNSVVEILMAFPIDQQNPTEPFCVFWNITLDRWSNEGCVVNSTDDNHTVCVCSHLTSFSVLMAKDDIADPILDMISRVGLGVSICSSLIFLLIESLVWSAVVKTNLSHFRHTALVNIAVFLLLAHCSFLASSSPESLSETWCLVLTICKHLFFLAMFCWMLCMSVMLVHQLIFVFSPLRKRVFMFLSSILGYVCPILIVGSSYVFCKYTSKDYYDKKTCWLVFDRLLEGSMHAFLLPVGTVVLTNLFSMVVVILTLVKTSVPDTSKAEDKETAKSILKVVVFLTPVFGVTWILGFFQLMLNTKDSMFTIVTYSFTILNSFQGLFILLTGCFAEQKVREEMIKFIMPKSKDKSESMKNLTTTTYTKDK